ncbi:MAG: [FeFe] hydrogenase H-cluster radical SAM maturase HydE [Ignavibacteriaceae bacterium]
MIEDILNKNDFTLDEIISLLQTDDWYEVQLIYQKADEVRKKYCGDEVHLRGIIEFSNYCEQDCLYCGLRNSNSNLERYRMTKREIIQTAKTIFDKGIQTIVLQSGEDFIFPGEEIAEIISSIKSKIDVAITLSLGERNFDEYKLWKGAGADRYLLKHETANPKLYSTYHLNQDLNDRIEHLYFLKSIGYQIGSGNITGLPKQSIKDIAEDIILCRELDLDMASFSPFIASPETPYRSQKNADVNFTLKVMAVARIVLKNVHIPATTALATLDEYGREKGLQVGANVIMPNFTPSPYREKYSIYPNKKCVKDNPLLCPACLENSIGAIGRRIASGKGHSLKIFNVT